MPLFRESQIQKHTPKTIKLTDLYQHLSGLNNLSTSDRIGIMEALQKSGYSYDSASRMLSGKNLNIAQAKEVALNLAKAGLKSFSGSDTNKLINKYVRKEAIKRKNIAGVRREFMMEALQEDIYKSKTPGLKYDKNGAVSKTSGSKTGRKIKLGF